MKCEFGREYKIDEFVVCQKEARYLLQYSVKQWLLEIDTADPELADMEMYSCEEHVSDIDFLFDPHHGLPQRIVEIISDRERPDLVEKIENLYEQKQKRSEK